MRRFGIGRHGKAVSRIAWRVEALETRRYFADRVVNGTDGNDVITVSFVNEWHVVINGNEQVFNDINPQIRGLEGNDTINVLSTREFSFLEVFGNSGDDTVTVGGGNVDANLFIVHVEGDGGTDTVVIDDRNSTTTTDYLIDLAHPALVGAEINFNDAQNLSIADDVQTLRLLTRTGLGTDTTIKDFALMGFDRIEVAGGSGNDRVNCVRFDGSAVVDFRGNGGLFDTLTYDTTFFGTGTCAAALDPNRLRTDGVDRATWNSTTEQVAIAFSDGDDTVNVNGVAAGQKVTFDGGDGADTYLIGNGDVDANILGEYWTMDRSDDVDRHVYNDAAGTTDDEYSINLLGFQKTGLAVGIAMFSDGDEVVVNANGGDNSISAFTSLAGAHHLTVNAGAGDDTIAYGGEHLTAGPSVLRGDSGNDTVVFNDSGPLRAGITDKDYTFVGGNLRYFQNGTVKSIHAYTAESVVVNAGAYDSTFSVLSTGIETSLTLNGGDGADQLSFVPIGDTTRFAFNGQGGADSINIDDTGDTIADVYVLTKTTFDKTGFGSLAFATTEAMTLRGHTGSNTFDVDGVAAGTALTIFAGNSADLFRVGAGDLDSNISGTLELVGEQGGDRVVFDDTADTGNDAYRLDDGVVTKSNVPAATMRYRFVEHVELNGSPGNNVFTFVSPGFALDVALRGFNGADTFDVNPSDRATVLVEASDPTIPPGDVLRFPNAATAGPSVLTPNGAVNGTYAFASAQQVTFLGIETFPLPPAAPETPDLVGSDDSGVSSVDNVTNRGVINLTGRAPAGALVVLLDGAAEVASGNASTAGVYSLGVVPSEGVHTYTAAVVAAVAGSPQLRGNASPALVVTVDFTAPPAPDAPDLAAASDTGGSTTDNLTRDNTPTLTGRAGTGTLVTLFNGATPVASAVAAGSTYSLTPPPVADGVHSFLVGLRDPAGNASPPGAALSVRVDTVAPRVIDATFTNVAPAELRFVFDEDVPDIAAEFVTVVNRTSGKAVDAMALRYIPNVAVLIFPLSGRVLPAGDYRATISTKIGDAAGNDPLGNNVFDFTAFAQVQGRRAFYNNSALDGNDPAAGTPDDAAVAADKTALLPGQAAGFVNVTSYTKGINGIMIDAAGLPADPSPSPADFELQVGNGTTWSPAPPPAAVALRRGAGPSGTDRITLTLPDGAVTNTWLRVTVKPTANTGLARPDVFYFGNLVGDSGGPGTPVVNSTDMALTRRNLGRTSPGALRVHDFNLTEESTRRT